jgi:hypothetical protein
MPESNGARAGPVFFMPIVSQSAPGFEIRPPQSFKLIALNGMKPTSERLLRVIPSLGGVAMSALRQFWKRG